MRYLLFVLSQRLSLSLDLFSTPLVHFTVEWAFSKILEINTFSILLQNVFLGSVGASVLKIALTKRLKIPLTISTHSLILDRLVILVVLVLMIIAAIPFRPENLVLTLDPIYVVLAILSSVALVWIFFGKNLLANSFKYKKYIPRIRTFFVPALIKSLLLSLFSLASYFVGIYLMCTYLDINLSFKDILVIIPTVTLVTSLPISLSGWGVREGAMIVGLGFLGIATEQALALSILIGILSLLSLLPLLIPSIFFRNKTLFSRLLKLKNDHL